MKCFHSLLCMLLIAVPARADDDFEKHIRPLLVEKCLKCHGPAKQSGGLRLDSRAFVLEGGHTGPAAVSGKPNESLLLEAVLHKGDLRMPPKKKLSDAEVGRLRGWIQRGLPWPAGTTLAQRPASEARGKGWSFQPLQPVAPPRHPKDSWSRNEIDRFIFATRAGKGLAPAPPADRRTLLRRANYDLTGLPPTAEEVEAFLQDARPDAFARVIDRLLASPAYGERWGRHWLDLVRYADTAGENSDHPIPDAWRYRNWVLGAFDRDLPYDQFVREQVAGDILARKGPDDHYAARVTATGFLALARRFGHDSDKDMHLTYEDTIDTLGKAFLGLSISCARCHDHKYDPISTSDYYALFGIFQSSRFAFPGCEAKQQPRDLTSMLSPGLHARLSEARGRTLAALDAESKQVARDRAMLESRLKASKPRLLARGVVSDGGAGLLAPSANTPLDPLEVRVGEMLRLAIGPLGNHGADSTLVELEIAEVGGTRKWNLTSDVLDDFTKGNPRPDRHGNLAVWYFLDGRGSPKLLAGSERNIQGKPGLHSWRAGELPSVFVNATHQPVQVWTRLPARSVFVHPAPDGPAVIGWVSPIAGKVRITGRIADAHPGGPNGVDWTLEHVSHDLGGAFEELAKLDARTEAIGRRRLEVGQSETIFAVVEGKAANARMHLRGDPEKLGPEVPRRWLDVFGGQPCPPGEGSGRLALAGWLTDASTPLLARVMVNRVWQWHFGKGLVKTPNDFGSRGLAPTHPELLDSLAARFVQEGWSVKSLHRRILLSATYQQAAIANPEAARLDPNNDLYWRFDRRRLSAEELRDGLLLASGQLDRRRGEGHPFPPERSWNFTQHNPFATVYETDRRSVYVVTIRNRRHPFFSLFDGADPNATTPQRQSTTVPTQALFFLNDPFFHAQADLLASRLLVQPRESVRLEELYRLALQRLPTFEDRKTTQLFLENYTASLQDVPERDRPRAAWAALTRIVLASNEFLFQE